MCEKSERFRGRIAARGPSRRFDLADFCVWEIGADWSVAASSLFVSSIYWTARYFRRSPREHRAVAGPTKNCHAREWHANCDPLEKLRSHSLFGAPEERLIAPIDCLVEDRQPERISSAAIDGCETLEGLIGGCMPRLFRVADCVLHNRHDSEDALQDGLLLALRHLQQFRGNSRFSTWLYSIVRNCALAKLRQRRARIIVSLDDRCSEDDPELLATESPADPGPDPEEACLQAELNGLFAPILDGLPPNYQDIIRLCDFEGFSGKEAAQRLGITASALKAKHHRARRALRQSIGMDFPGKSGARATGNQSNRL
jgi:RNA polymerase sigma-70 factor, ECF subfamily